jgi:stage II sporulation protein R
MKNSKSVLLIEAAVALGLVITILLSSISAFAKDYEHIKETVLRFHILANSDSEADQALKLEVRDAVLAGTAEVFKEADNTERAVAAAEEALPEIERIAKETIKAAGYSYPVHAEVTTMPFDTRVYGDITMPAGEYKAIRVTIGEAKGKNWWCVMFPQLCLPAFTEEQSEDVFNEFLSESEQDILRNPTKYEGKFYILEMWNKYIANKE